MVTCYNNSKNEYTKYSSPFSRKTDPRDGEIHKEIHYKELAHATLESEKSHAVASAIWRPRKVSESVPV